MQQLMLWMGRKQSVPETEITRRARPPFFLCDRIIAPPGLGAVCVLVYMISLRKMKCSNPSQGRESAVSAAG